MRVFQKKKKVVASTRKGGSVNGFDLIVTELNILKLLDDVVMEPRQSRATTQGVAMLMKSITCGNRKKFEKRKAKPVKGGPKTGNRSY